MKSAPAILMFAMAAVGLIAVREWVTGGHAPAAVAEPAAKAEPAQPVAPHSASLRKEADGHYWATAYVNGSPMRFLVDTGASVIALTETDARRAGLDVESLPHTADVSTASGHVKAAVASLDSVRISGVEVKGVEAVVMTDGLEQSLLGMSFLNRLKGWQVTPSALVLKQ